MEITTETYGIKRVVIKLSEGEIKVAVHEYVKEHGKSYLEKEANITVELYSDENDDYVAEVIAKYKKKEDKGE